MGVEEVLEFAEGFDGTCLGGGGDGRSGVAAEDDRLFETVDGEETAGGGVGADD